MIDDYMLTTLDNPYDPFEEFDDWLMYDMQKGYNSCGLLARIVEEQEGLSEKESQDAIDRAMDFIIANDPFKNYTKVPPNFIKQTRNPH